MHIDGWFVDRIQKPALFVRSITPQRIKVHLLFVHASMVHSEYYLPLAVRLADQGVAVWLPDLRGHGRSRGPRGHIRHWQEHVDDVAAAFQLVRDHAGSGEPCLVGGESYGALMAYVSLSRQVCAADGAVLLSPAFELKFQFSPGAYWLLNRMARPLLPRVRPLVPLGYGGVSEQPHIGRLIDTDPMTSRRYTLSFLMNLVTVQKEIQHKHIPLAAPTLAIVSEGDRICDNRATEHLLGSDPLATVVRLPGGEHSLVADMPEAVTSMVVSWLARTGLEAAESPSGPDGRAGLDEDASRSR